MAELRHELGLDRSWLLQYFDIVKSAFTFDFGRSWNTKQEIIEMIRQGAGPSLTLTLPAFALATILSISISLFVAFYRGKTVDKVVPAARDRIPASSITGPSAIGSVKGMPSSMISTRKAG